MSIRSVPPLKRFLSLVLLIALLLTLIPSAVLAAPAPAPAAAPVASASGTHTVTYGDTLSGIAVSHGNGEFSFFGCLQQASMAVNEGAMIRRGALLARVGNSWLTPGPHLHYHLMEGGPNPFLDQGVPFQWSHFSAGGQFFAQPVTIPTRMIVNGPVPEPAG